MKYWKKLTYASKIIFVVWTSYALYMLFSGKSDVSFPKWISVWLFGCLLFVGIAQFSSKNKKIFDESKTETIGEAGRERKGEAIEDSLPVYNEANSELIEALKECGDAYVNFFDEILGIHSVLKDYKIIENEDMEFIIDFDTSELAKYIVSKENDLNQILKSAHKLSLLDGKCVVLVVKKDTSDVNDRRNEDSTSEFQYTHMSERDLERFARECNAYVARKERMEEKNQFAIAKELSESEAVEKINRANKLANIANKTTDREEFYNAINEIESILTELSMYECKFNFSYPPSADLRDLRCGKNKQIELLEKRIAEREKETLKASASAIDSVKKYNQNDYYTKIEEEKEKIAYNDRFYEDYRPIPRKTIAFTGNNFSEPAVQACAALIISGSVKRGEKIKPNDYYKYFENLYGVVNIRKLHIWLCESGYLRNATPKEALNLYKVDELKTILDSMGLKKNGNKSSLIDRIAENLDDSMKEKLSSECDRYFRSEKGEIFLAENQDFVMFHKNQYGLNFQEFCRHRILQGRKRKFYDTVFHALSQRASEWQEKKFISQLEWVYHNLSNALYDEEKYELSLQNALYSLYFSTNLASKYYLFSLENVRFDGIETAKSRIDSESTFNPHIVARILELQPYFREQMLDVVYTPEILPYCLFGKYDMLDVVLDLHDGTFDVDKYTNYIRISYGNYAKKFL